MKPLNIQGNRRQYLVKNLKFNYDSLNDLLYVYKPESNVYANVVIGEFHLEFDKNGEVVGLEVLKASEILSEYEVSEETLKNIEKINIKIVIRDNSLLMFLMIFALNEQKSIPVTMNSLKSPLMQIK